MEAPWKHFSRGIKVCREPFKFVLQPLRPLLLVPQPRKIIIASLKSLHLFIFIFTNMQTPDPGFSSLDTLFLLLLSVVISMVLGCTTHFSPEVPVISNKEWDMYGPGGTHRGIPSEGEVSMKSKKMTEWLLFLHGISQIRPTRQKCIH